MSPAERVTRPPANRAEFILNLAWWLDLVLPDTGPQLTAAEFLAGLASPLTHWHDQCGNCGYVLVNFEGEASTRPRLPWYHSEGPRGCRAASFERAGGWDDRLPGTAKARPVGNWEADDTGTCHICRVAREFANLPEEAKT